MRHSQLGHVRRSAFFTDNIPRRSPNSSIATISSPTYKSRKNALDVVECSLCFYSVGIKYTVRKFKYFSITKILREINFRGYGNSKTAILTISGALNFIFHEFVEFLRAEIYEKLKISEPINMPQNMCYCNTQIDST